MKVGISVREDGAILLACKIPNGEVDLFPGDLIDITDYPEANQVFLMPDNFIYQNGQMQERTESQMEARVREIYNRVKSGELIRCVDDLLVKHRRFFTAKELEDVELPSEKIKRLEQTIVNLKQLETGTE